MAENRHPEEGSALTNRHGVFVGEAGIPASGLETGSGQSRTEPEPSEQFENRSRTEEDAAVAKLLDVSLRQCPTTDERAAMRSGMGDSTALCDVLERIILEENRGRGGKSIPTKRGRDLAAIAKRCGDAIWAMREQVTVPHEPSP